MSTKKKIVYTVLLGIVVLIGIYYSVQVFQSALSYINMRNEAIKEGNRIATLYLRVVWKNLGLSFILALSSIVSLILIIEFWKGSINLIKYSYEDYKREKIKMQEIKKAKKKKKLEEKLKKL